MAYTWIEVFYALIITALTWRILWSAKTAWIEALSNRQTSFLFLAKLCVGLGLTLLYDLYYGNRDLSDAFKFFDDALIINSYFSSDFLAWLKVVFGFDLADPQAREIVAELDHWFKNHKPGVFNDNQTIIRFHALLMPLSMGFYLVHLVVINVISVFGFIGLLRFFESVGIRNKWFAYSVVLFPQVIFWSSGLLKESLLFGVFGWLWYFGCRVLTSPSVRSFLIFGITIFLSAIIKSYVLLCVLPALLLLSKSMLPGLSIKIKFALVVLCILGTGFLGNQMFDLRIPDRVYQKQHDFINEAHESGANSYFESFILEPSWPSLIKNAPMAAVNAWTKPWIWESKNVLMFGAGAENLFLLFMLILLLIYPQKAFFESHAFYSFLLFIVFLSVIIGWVTPISGAMVRYKIPMIPFYLAIVYMGVDWKRIKMLGIHHE